MNLDAILKDREGWFYESPDITPFSGYLLNPNRANCWTYNGDFGECCLQVDERKNLIVYEECVYFINRNMSPHFVDRIIPTEEKEDVKDIVSLEGKTTKEIEEILTKFENAL